MQNKIHTNTAKGNILFVIFLLLYTACIVYLCFVMNIWEDESYTLYTTSNKLTDIISLSYSFEGQPPAYFILMGLWRSISTDVIFAKFFSIISIGFAAYFFHKLVSFISGKENSHWLVAIFLLNPFTVWAALEIRVYAFLILLSVITVYYFIQYFTNSRKKDLYIFLLVSLIGTFTQYFFTLEIAALAFSVLIFKGWKKFFNFCLYLLPVVLLFLPNFLYLQGQVRMHEQLTEENAAVKTLLSILYTPQNFLLALQMVPFGRWVRWIIKIIFILLLIFGYYKMLKNRGNENNGTLKKLNVLLLAAGFLIILYSVVILLTKIGYSAKYMAIVFPSILLLLILMKQYQPGLRKLIFICGSVYFAGLLFLFYKIPVKDYDYKFAAAYISKTVQPGEPILFYNNLIALPFSYYYPGKNKIEPLPHPVTFDSNYICNIADTLQLNISLNKAINNSSSFMLITNDLATISLNKNMNRNMVDSFLVKHYRIVLDTLFYGRSENRYLRIRRLKR